MQKFCGRRIACESLGCGAEKSVGRLTKGTKARVFGQPLIEPAHLALSFETSHGDGAGQVQTADSGPGGDAQQAFLVGFG